MYIEGQLFSFYDINIGSLGELQACGAVSRGCFPGFPAVKQRFSPVFCAVSRIYPLNLLSYVMEVGVKTACLNDA